VYAVWFAKHIFKSDLDVIVDSVWISVIQIWTIVTDFTTAFTLTFTLTFAETHL